jgi:ribosomal 30S subunit maturation factor RimM
MKNDRMVTMGKIGAPVGLEGWHRVKWFGSIIPNQATVYYQPYQQPTWQSFAYDAWCITEQRVKPPVTLLSAVNGYLGVHRTALPVLSPNHYYWHDLLHLNVINALHVTEPMDDHPAYLGKVSAVRDIGPYPMLIVQHHTVEHSIPFVVPHIVHTVSLAHGFLLTTCDWIT